MPPRLPAVLVFVVVYFAAVAGGGFDAPALTVTLWSPDIAARLGLAPGALGPLDGWTAAVERITDGWLYLRLDESLAFFAAALALPDAAWRPARTRWDLAASLAAAALTLGAMAVEPRFLTPAFGVLAAITVGDALAALGARRLTPAAKPRA